MRWDLIIWSRILGTIQKFLSGAYMLLYFAHQKGDITDLAVSSNNAVVASSSNDFVIRVVSSLCWQVLFCLLLYYGQINLYLVSLVVNYSGVCLMGYQFQSYEDILVLLLQLPLVPELHISFFRKADSFHHLAYLMKFCFSFLMFFFSQTRKADFTLTIYKLQICWSYKGEVGIVSFLFIDSSKMQFNDQTVKIC